MKMKDSNPLWSQSSLRVRIRNCSGCMQDSDLGTARKLEFTYVVLISEKRAKVVLRGQGT